MHSFPMVSVGQDVLTNEPSRNLKIQLSIMGPSVVTEAGATIFISASDLPKVLLAYIAAVTKVFYVSVALACPSLRTALVIEWKSVKGKKAESNGVELERELSMIGCKTSESKASRVGRCLSATSG